MQTGCLYIPDFPAWALARTVWSATVPSSAPMVAIWAGRVIAIRGARGVEVGDRADRVARLCPEAAVRVRDIHVEQACWEGVLRSLHRVTPFIESADPPFVCFRADTGDALDTLAAESGIQVGMAGHRATARLAAVRAASGHVLRIPDARRVAFLDRFDVDRLPELGYEPDTAERLGLFGYPMLGAVRALTERQLKAQFGTEGIALYAMVHPKRDRPIPLFSPPPAIEVWHDLDGAVDAPGLLVPVLYDLVQQAVARLGGMRTQRISLLLQTTRVAEPRTVGRLLPTAHHESAALSRFVVRLLEEAAQPDEEIDRVGLRLEALRHPSVTQVSMFDERPAVLGAVRHVHRRYPGIIRRAVMRPDALFVEDEMVLDPLEDA